MKATEGSMQDNDVKVKKLLGALDLLFKKKLHALECGLSVVSIDVDIDTLMGALKMLEGKPRG